MFLNDKKNYFKTIFSNIMTLTKIWDQNMRCSPDNEGILAKPKFPFFYLLELT